MPTYLDIVTALPKIGNGSKSATRSFLVKRIAYALDASEDLRTITVTDPDYGAVPLYVVQNRRLYEFDSADTTTAHDGTTCLVSADGLRYKIDDYQLPYSVKSKTLTAPPASPTIGDNYIIAAAATGAWASHDNEIATYTSRGWQFAIIPQGRSLYNEADQSFYYRNEAGSWTRGVGALPFSANSVPLSARIGAGASGIIKVENQTTNSPPGSRITGGTPTVPLGGTSANINDNTTSTTSTTSALGDLSAAAIASRIIAKIDFGSSKSLTGIEAKQLRLSTGTGTAGLYYSTDGTSWTQLSTNLSLTSTATDFVRTGSVTARYVAVILAQANYSTATATLSDINGYDSTIVASVGTAYIIGSAPFGPWAGNPGKVAICELANTFTIYSPAAGDEVYDKALTYPVAFDGTQWSSARGAIIQMPAPKVTLDTSNTTESGSGPAYTYSNTSPPGTSYRHLRDDAGVAIAAKRFGAVGDENLIFQWEGRASMTGTGNFTFGLLRDSESTAIAWCDKAFNTGTQETVLRFIVPATDLLSHTYKIFCVMNPSSDRPITFAHRQFTVMEKV